MRRRRAAVLAAAALLGAAAAVLPAIAASEGSTITAVNRSETSHYWSPMTATIGAGGSVTIENPTSVAHGVEWVEGPEKPHCSEGVPVGSGPSASGINWSGSCTFSKPGTYVFYCTVHGPYMSATVTVTASGTTTGPGAPPTSTTQPAGGSPPPAGGGGEASPGSPQGQGAGASPLAGAGAIEIPPRQRGRTVRGSVDVSRAGVGGRLEVELLAVRAALAAGSSKSLPVGRLLRRTPAAGRLRFAVGLTPRARAALARRGHLALQVRVRLRSPAGRVAGGLARVLLRR